VLISYQRIRECEELVIVLRFLTCSVDKVSHSNFLNILNGIRVLPVWNELHEQGKWREMMANGYPEGRSMRVLASTRSVQRGLSHGNSINLLGSDRRGVTKP
jgi:hypothetical protein